METIFDHQVTPKEVAAIIPFKGFTKERYLGMNLEQDDFFADIAVLFSIRGDNAQAETYRLKINRKGMRDNLFSGDIIPS